MTLNNELYVGQRLFLIQGTKMKIVEVMKVSETDDMMHLRVKNLHDQEIIELSCSLDYDSPDYSITWMIISIPYITELVIERMKQRFHK